MPLGRCRESGWNATLHDVLAGVLFPPRTAALQPHFEETLARGFDVAAAEGQPETTGAGVVHPLGALAMALEVGNGGMDRVIVAVESAT